MTQQIIATRQQEASIVSLMKNYANYNLWANITLVDWLRTKEPSLLEKEVISSFPSLRLTLIHIWQTEAYWLSILKRTGPETYTEFTGTTEEVLNGLLEKSAEVAEYINALSQEDVEETTLIVNPWFQSDFQNLEYIMHLGNHSTYHRGQVITMSRNLGLTDPPMTDYNYYNVMAK